MGAVAERAVEIIIETRKIIANTFRTGEDLLWSTLYPCVLHVENKTVALGGAVIPEVGSVVLLHGPCVYRQSIYIIFF